MSTVPVVATFEKEKINLGKQFALTQPMKSTNTVTGARSTTHKPGNVSLETRD